MIQGMDADPRASLTNVALEISPFAFKAMLRILPMGHVAYFTHAKPILCT